MKKHYLAYVVLFLFLLVLDQSSKYWAEHILQNKTVPIFSWLDFSLVHNPGAAFGFLSQAGGWQHAFFISLAIIVCVVLCFMIRQLQPRERHLRVAYTLIIIGAIGNVMDRIFYGYVIDFIHVFYLECNIFGMRDCHYPHFNIADSLIFIGAALVLFEACGKSFLNKRDATHNC